MEGEVSGHRRKLPPPAARRDRADCAAAAFCGGVPDLTVRRPGKSVDVAFADEIRLLSGEVNYRNLAPLLEGDPVSPRRDSWTPGEAPFIKNLSRRELEASLVANLTQNRQSSSVGRPVRCYDPLEDLAGRTPPHRCPGRSAAHTCPPAQ